MLDGRVLGASQVEYRPFGKPPLNKKVSHPADSKWCSTDTSGASSKKACLALSWPWLRPWPWLWPWLWPSLLDMEDLLLRLCLLLLLLLLLHSYLCSRPPAHQNHPIPPPCRRAARWKAEPLAGPLYLTQGPNPVLIAAWLTTRPPESRISHEAREPGFATLFTTTPSAKR